jgi:hypothetical protein
MPVMDYAANSRTTRPRETSLVLSAPALVNDFRLAPLQMTLSGFGYVCIGGQLRKIMVVIKMRGGNHSKDIREYEITSQGVVIIGDRLTDYQGLITGIPEHLNRSRNHAERLHKANAKTKSYKQSRPTLTWTALTTGVAGLDFWSYQGLTEVNCCNRAWLLKDSLSAFVCVQYIFTAILDSPIKILSPDQGDVLEGFLVPPRESRRGTRGFPSGYHVWLVKVIILNIFGL